MSIAWDMTHWNWAQYTSLGISALYVVTETALSGQPRTGNHNGSLAIVALVMSLFIQTAGGYYA